MRRRTILRDNSEWDTTYSIGTLLLTFKHISDVTIDDRILVWA